MKSLVFVLGLLLAAIPLAGQADPEQFVLVDGSPVGATSNELGGNLNTTGWGVNGAAELPPILGYTFMVQASYHTFNYVHKSNNAMLNGVAFGCPTASDPGCVTPIGYQVYNAAFNPGPVNYLNGTNAQDSTTQVGASLKVANPDRYYVGLGWVFRGFNYLSYPLENGFGAGLDKLPDLDRPFSFYGSIWFFFNVHGQYTGPTSAGLGALSAQSFNVAYHMYTYRVGVTYKLQNSPLFFDLSDVGDRSDAGQNAPGDSQHNLLFLGVGGKI